MKAVNLKKRLTIWALVVTIILMIPLLTMAPWGVFDFVFAGAILFGSAASYEIAASKMKNKTFRFMAAGAAMVFVVFIWFLAVS